jgi:UDP-N-acetylmuramoyl-L-alanyl-D-glutamate--2,6-diaminopimelate ligase
MEDYFAAKARLFDGRAETNVVVVDDVWGERLARLAGPAVTVSTGGTAATWQASDVRVLDSGATAFVVHGPPGVLEAGCAVPGTYNVANALLALAMLDAVGVGVEDAAPAVAGAVVPGRMERIDEGQPFNVLVDYAHTDDALRNLLETARPIASRRLITVFGAGGDRDRTKRPLMGMVAARMSDIVVITSDNPRTEDPERIIEEVKRGTTSETRQSRAEVLTIVDRREAIETAIKRASPGDVVLIAGKGHEKYQDVGGRTFPFDDVAVAREALEARRVKSRVR